MTPSSGCGVGGDMPGEDVVQVAAQHVAPQRRQAVVEGGRRLIRLNKQRLLHIHWPGVQPFVHAHEGHAGRRVAGQQGVLDWRRAAPARQQRGVDVDAAVRRQIEHVRPENLAEGGDDDDLRPPLVQWRSGFLAAQRPGLVDGEARRGGGQLDRRRAQLPAAAGRLVGLADDADNHLRGDQGLQNGHGKLRRAHEDDSGHGGHSSMRRAAGRFIHRLHDRQTATRSRRLRNRK